MSMGLYGAGAGSRGLARSSRPAASGTGVKSLLVEDKS
jgi:hypothetical protein